MTCPEPFAPVCVDEASQIGEQRRRPMHLVNDNELAGLCGQKRPRIRELGDISWVFEIKINRGPLVGDLAGKRRFSDLPRAEEGDRRLTCKRVDDPCLRSSSNQQPTIHSCKLHMQY